VGDMSGQDSIPEGVSLQNHATLDCHSGGQLHPAHRQQGELGHHILRESSSGALEKEERAERREGYRAGGGSHGWEIAPLADS